ncbi:MAG: 3'-5' exonuclease [Promethearchaeia archaeon]
MNWKDLGSYKKILVVDLETDGLNPSSDRIVEIGIASLDASTLEISEEYSNLIKDKYLNAEAWIFENTDLTKEKVLSAGKRFEKIESEIQKLFNQFPACAYNAKFDFGFLKSYGIRIENTIFDPMPIMRDHLKIPHWKYGFKLPSVQECLDYLGIKKQEPHRALRDAMLEAEIIKQMIKEGIV